MSRSAAPIGEVREAVLAYMRAQGQPVSVYYQHVKGVADRLGVTLDDSTRQGRADLGRFTSQVQRSLDWQVRQGMLAKSRRYGRNEYWTPAAFAVHEAALEQARQQKSANAEVWARIGQEMALYGFEAMSEPGKPLQYSLEDWQRIIAAVEAARAAQLSS